MKQSERENNRRFFAQNLVNSNDQLYYYALQLTEDQEDARDLVQETNFKALKNYSRVKNIEHKNAWLYTILRNTHINNLRSGHYKNIQLGRKENEGKDIASQVPENEIPDRIYERKELVEKIRCLPPAYAKPLKLYMAGYAYKEIANMTGVPIGTVKSRIHIAKQKLRKAYLNC